MIDVRIATYDKAQLLATKKKLRVRSMAAVMRQLPLHRYIGWILRRFKKESPRGHSAYRTEWLRWLRAGGSSASRWAASQKEAFHKGWISEGFTAFGNAVRFNFTHQLDSLGQEGRARFKAITEGHGAFSYTVKKRFSFMRTKKARQFMNPGVEVNVPAQEAHPVISQTTLYINGFIAQQLERDMKKLFEAA